jgi:hypothetical protein
MNSLLVNYIQQNYQHLTEEKEPLEVGKAYSFSDFTLDPIYDRYLDLINEEFPHAPFSISLGPNELLLLDQPFSIRKKIKLIDTNITSFNYYYTNVPDEIINKMKKSIYVHQIDNQSITLRQILNTLIQHKHFKGFKGKDNHCFLEGINESDPGIYSLAFGS